MSKLWAVYSCSGSMLTPKLVLKHIDTETARTAVAVARPCREHGILNDGDGETGEAKTPSTLDPEQRVTGVKGADPPRR